MWSAVGNLGVWGPYFFEEKDKAVSVTSACYAQMLQNLAPPKLQNVGENTTAWFRQDGTTAHTAKNNRCFARTPSSAFDFLRGIIG